jgi:hypothetical protein
MPAGTAPGQANPANAAAGAATFRFIRTITVGSADVTCAAERSGKQSAYLVRWISATGEPGP